MATPMAEDLLNALHTASDLDVVRQIYSNPISDQQCPWLGVWVLELCNAEQQRRDAERESETDFHVVDTAGVALDSVIQSSSFAWGAYRTAENVRDPEGHGLPTVAAFAWTLAQVLFAELALRAKTAQQQGASIG